MPVFNFNASGTANGPVGQGSSQYDSHGRIEATDKADAEAKLRQDADKNDRTVRVLRIWPA